MRKLIAGTITALVAASAVGTASGQGTTSTARKQATAAPAQARPQVAPAAKGSAPKPLTPDEIKARQLADQKAKTAMIPILAEWEKQSKKVTTLSVPFQRVDRSVAWGDEYFQGRALLKAPNLACLEWNKCKVDPSGKPLKKPNAKGEMVYDIEPLPEERVICNGVNVLQYAYGKKVLYVFPLEKEARQKALQEGPLPFLFNMKADEATRRYGMRLLQEDENEFLIAIVPNDPADRGNFERAFLWLKKENYLPNRLRLYPVQSGQDQAKESQEFTFYNIDSIRPIDDTFFNPPIKMPGWQTVVNPVEGAQPASGRPAAAAPGQVPAAKRAATQPATKAGVRQ